MFASIYSKIVSLFMSLLIALGIISPTPDDNVEITASASLVFENELAGSAAGTAQVESNVDGEYDFYWTDEAGERLTAQAGEYTVSYSEFVTVDVENGQGSEELNEFLAIPAGAYSYSVYYGDKLVDSEALPENKLPQYGEKLYSFGALSDVHFNRYSDDTGDIAMQAFPAALDFLSAFGVDLVGISGDISNNGERDSYEKYNSIASGYDFPIYTSKGNHDCKYLFELSAWQENMNTGVYGENKREGVVNVADNGLDFVYAPQEANGDVFIFFSQTEDTYFPFVRLVSEEQLDWLEAQLEAYKDRRVYLFFHTFFGAPDGLLNMCEGNLVNKAGASYILTYIKGNCDERRFRSLLEEYKNVMFFNGHSHWSYDMQKYNSRLNITDYDGKYCTMVHVSSVSGPRTTDDYSPAPKTNAGDMSEGLLVEVYGGGVLITACDFKNARLLSYATYIN